MGWTNIAPRANIAPSLIMKTWRQALLDSSDPQILHGHFVRCLRNLCTVSTDASWDVHRLFTRRPWMLHRRLHLAAWEYYTVCPQKSARYLWRVAYVVISQYSFKKYCVTILINTALPTSKITSTLALIVMHCECGCHDAVTPIECA